MSETLTGGALGKRGLEKLRDHLLPTVPHDAPFLAVLVAVLHQETERLETVGFHGRASLWIGVVHGVLHAILASGLPILLSPLMPALQGQTFIEISGPTHR